MKTAVAKNGSRNAVQENAFAKQALENIAKIDKEAQTRKLEQLESLRSAKGAITDRMKELENQLEQIERAIATITGAPVATREKRARRSWEGERERVGRWLEGRRGQKIGAGDLIRELPEWDGQVMSIFLKPLIEAGKVKTDQSEGVRRTKYFVGEGAE